MRRTHANPIVRRTAIGFLRRSHKLGAARNRECPHFSSESDVGRPASVPNARSPSDRRCRTSTPTVTGTRIRSSPQLSIGRYCERPRALGALPVCTARRSMYRSRAASLLSAYDTAVADMVRSEVSCCEPQTGGMARTDQRGKRVRASVLKLPSIPGNSKLSVTPIHSSSSRICSRSEAAKSNHRSAGGAPLALVVEFWPTSSCAFVRCELRLMQDSSPSSSARWRLR